MNTFNRHHKDLVRKLNIARTNTSKLPPWVTLLAFGVFCALLLLPARSQAAALIGSRVAGTTHTPESGTNRALVFTAHAESSTGDTNLAGVTYGGQAMTKVVDRIEFVSYAAYACAFILDEAGIAAATSSDFVVTWGTAPSGTPAFSSVFLSDVDQITLVGGTGTGGSTTATAETPTLSTNAGDMAFVAGTCGTDEECSTIKNFWVACLGGCQC